MNTEMGARVRLRREELGMTQLELATKVGCSQPMIKKIEAGSKTSLGRKLALALKTSLDWLETGTGADNEALVKPVTLERQSDSLNSGSEASADYNGAGRTLAANESTVGERLELRRGRDIPVIGEAQGGADGCISINDYPAGYGDGWITLYSADPNAYGLRVRGDSMRPRIKSGEFIVVEPGIEAQPGDDVVVKFVDGSAVVKELMWVRDHEACLGSVNNGIPPITRPLDTIRSIHRVAAIIPRGSPLYRSAT